MALPGLRRRWDLLHADASAAGAAVPPSVLDDAEGLRAQLDDALAQIYSAAEEARIEARDRGQECPVPPALAGVILWSLHRAHAANHRWLDVELPARRRGRVTRRDLDLLDPGLRRAGRLRGRGVSGVRPHARR